MNHAARQAVQDARKPGEAAFLLRRSEAHRSRLVDLLTDLLTGSVSGGERAQDMLRGRVWVLLTDGSDRPRILNVRDGRVASVLPTQGWDPDRQRPRGRHVQAGWHYRVVRRID